MAEATPGVATPAAPVTAEVVTPSPETTAVPSGEKPEEGAEPRAPEPEKMLPQSEVNKLIQKRERIAASRAERLAMERFRAEAAERELERLRAERNAPAQPMGEPKPSDFENPADYLRAVARWEAKQLREQERQEEQSRQKEQREQHVERSKLERARSAAEKLWSEGEAKYRDFADAVSDENLPFDDALLIAASKLKAGPDVLYHLGKNPQEATRLATLDTIELAWELKALEAKLTAAPKSTETPPPIKPNSGSSAAVTGYRPDMTDKEFAEWRRRSIAQRR